MKTCPFGGKVSYASEHAAKKALITINRKNMRSYQCQNCFMFHLTTEPRGTYKNK